MPTTTTNYGLNKPLVNDATDQDLWGGYLNTNMDDLDGLLKTCLNFTSSSKTTTFTATIPTAGSTTTGSAKVLYLCDASSGAYAANLPDASTASGLTIAFKKIDSSANAITLTPNGSDTIDGASTQALSSQYSYMIIVCDGTGWNIIAQTPPSVTVPQFQHSEFTTIGSNTFTTPSNITTSTRFKFIVTGGGAGGISGYYGGAGGGSGATAIYYATGLSPSTGYSITVGAGGSAGSAGTSSTLIIGAVTVTGGAGSAGASANGGPGGAGGTATNGSINISGGGGGSGTNSNQIDTGGLGGASYWGGGGKGSNSSTGNAGVAYGSGGSGGSNSNTGGAGAQGIVTVEWIA